MEELEQVKEVNICYQPDINETVRCYRSIPEASWPLTVEELTEANAKVLYVRKGLEVLYGSFDPTPMAVEDDEETPDEFKGYEEKSASTVYDEYADLIMKTEEDSFERKQIIREALAVFRVKNMVNDHYVWAEGPGYSAYEHLMGLPFRGAESE